MVVLLKKKEERNVGEARYLFGSGKSGAGCGEGISDHGACHFALPATTYWRAAESRIK